MPMRDGGNQSYGRSAPSQAGQNNGSSGVGYSSDQANHDSLDAFGTPSQAGGTAGTAGKTSGAIRTADQVNNDVRDMFGTASQAGGTAGTAQGSSGNSSPAGGGQTSSVASAPNSAGNGSGFADIAADHSSPAGGGHNSYAGSAGNNGHDSGSLWFLPPQNSALNPTLVQAPAPTPAPAQSSAPSPSAVQVEANGEAVGEQSEGRSIGGRILWGSDDPPDPRLYDMDVDALTALAEQQRYIPSTIISASSLLVADAVKAGAELLTKNWLMEKAIQVGAGTLYARGVTGPVFEVSNAFHEHMLGQPIVDENPGLLSERMLGDVLPGLASTATGMMAANAARMGVGSLLAGTALAPFVALPAAIGAGVAASSKTYSHLDQAWQNYSYDPTDPVDLQRFLNNLTPEQLQDYEDNQDLLGLLDNEYTRQRIADLNLETLQNLGPTLAESTAPLSGPLANQDAIDAITAYLDQVGDDAIVVADADTTPSSQDLLDQLVAADEFNFDDLMRPTFNEANAPIIDETSTFAEALADTSGQTVIVDVWHDPADRDLASGGVVAAEQSQSLPGEDHGEDMRWLVLAPIEEVRNGGDGDYGGYSSWDGA